MGTTVGISRRESLIRLGYKFINCEWCGSEFHYKNSRNLMLCDKCKQLKKNRQSLRSHHAKRMQNISISNSDMLLVAEAYDNSIQSSISFDQFMSVLYTYAESIEKDKF